MLRKLALWLVGSRATLDQQCDRILIKVAIERRLGDGARPAGDHVGRRDGLTIEKQAAGTLSPVGHVRPSRPSAQLMKDCSSLLSAQAREGGNGKLQSGLRNTFEAAFAENIYEYLSPRGCVGKRLPSRVSTRAGGDDLALARLAESAPNTVLPSASSSKVLQLWHGPALRVRHAHHRSARCALIHTSRAFQSS